jgi:HPt (histidine-containing phosphotransfer) domain-containing protein
VTSAPASSFDSADALRQAGGDEYVLREIMELFLEDLPNREADLRRALERRDAKLLERTAHTIKGSCMTLGAAAAREAAYRLELLARAGGFDGADEAAARLSEETARLTHGLKRFLDAPPA